VRYFFFFSLKPNSLEQFHHCENEPLNHNVAPMFYQLQLINAAFQQTMAIIQLLL